MLTLAERVQKTFPQGGATPETEYLMLANWCALHFGWMNSEPQHPEAVGVACSQIDLNRVQGINRLGWLFKGTSRGARLSPEGIASIAYPFAHLGEPTPPFMEIVVHSCTEQGICRGGIFDIVEKPDANLVSLAASPRLDTAAVLAGLKSVPMAYDQSRVPEPDRLHARSRLLKMLQGSDLIRELMVAGKLIVGEAYYETSTGRVHWLNFWTSAERSKEVPTGLIRAIVEGKIDSEADLEGVHPGLKSLNALVLGNEVFTRQFELPVPTEVVVFGCSDSRVGSLVMKTPHGLVEWIHSAGNVVDARMLRSLRVATEAAVSNVERDFDLSRDLRPSVEPRRHRAVLAVMSHSRCGAVGAALHHLCGHGSHASTSDPAKPVVDSIAPRFDPYLNNFSDPISQDEYLVQAAEANAVGTCMDILNGTGEDAEAIRVLVSQDRLIVVPAWYLLTSGVIQMRPPLSLAAAQRANQPLAGNA